jgi:hypothetical protein
MSYPVIFEKTALFEGSIYLTELSTLLSSTNFRKSSALKLWLKPWDTSALLLTVFGISRLGF